MADAPRTLHEYVAQLKQGDVVALPNGARWKEHVAHISVPGRIAAITQEQSDYWLQVLPPRWQCGAQFCFAEGVEPLRLFWYDTGTKQRRCRQLTWDETVEFCRLANISIPW